MSSTLLKKDTILYHGTVYNFEPTQIKTPCWFSTIKSEAINHICYRHRGNTNGKILKYKVTKDIELLDISKNGELRLYMNSNGNYKLAKYIAKGKWNNKNGYINYPDQAEVMLVALSHILYIDTEYVDLSHRVIYKRVGFDWRMKNDTKSCCTLM